MLLKKSEGIKKWSLATQRKVAARRKALELLKASETASEEELTELDQLNSNAKKRQRLSITSSRRAKNRRRERLAFLKAKMEETSVTAAERQELKELEAHLAKVTANNTKRERDRRTAMQQERKTLAAKLADVGGTDEQRQRLKQLDDWFAAETATSLERRAALLEQMTTTRDALTAKRQRGEDLTAAETKELAEAEAWFEQRRTKAAETDETKRLARQARTDEMERLGRKIAAKKGTVELDSFSLCFGTKCISKWSGFYCNFGSMFFDTILPDPISDQAHRYLVCLQ